MIYIDEKTKQLIEEKSAIETFGNKKVFKIADILSDMILFHKKVRKNGVEMMKSWDEDE